jgi:uncharacterized Zn-finger protein
MKADKGKLDNRFKCPYCQELFSNYGDWLKHMKGHGPLILCLSPGHFPTRKMYIPVYDFKCEENGYWLELSGFITYPEHIMYGILQV